MKKSKKILIANGQRKSGKSTTALNLSLCLSSLGKKVLLFDTTDGNFLKRLLKSENKFNSTLNQILPLFHYYSSLDQELPELSGDYDYLIIDSEINNWTDSLERFNDELSMLIPIESEFYGLNNQEIFFQSLVSKNVKIEGILPVMVRSQSEVSTNMIKQIKGSFGNLVFDTYIVRNYYLARQSDIIEFDLKLFTEKAAFTYLNVANILIERNK